MEPIEMRPATAVIILPPTTTYHRTTGLPSNVYIGVPLLACSSYQSQDDIHLKKVLMLIKNEQYKEATTELNKFTNHACNNLSRMEYIKNALKRAYEKSDDQQYEIWKNVDVIGCAGFCCIALNEPLKSMLPLPPNTDCALYTTCSYIAYTCYQHARQRQHLELLKKRFDSLSTIPPMYTIKLPPPTMTMNYSTQALSESPIIVAKKKKE